VYSIGEFSRITGLSIKTLRFYHDKGLLVPSYVERGSGYRYYDAGNSEKALVIVQLRTFGFSLQQIREILDQHDDEAGILDYLERQHRVMLGRVAEFGETARRLEAIIHKEREARRLMQESTFEVEEKHVNKMQIAGIRMTGRYSDCGAGFGKVCRAFGRWTCGKPFLLHYSQEYRETDADFEACVPIRKAHKQVEGVSVRELPGGRCVSLLHKGPYEDLGRSYEKVFAYLQGKDLRTIVPSREIYIKGPGMIFRGNPKKYLTEIQFLIEE